MMQHSPGLLENSVSAFNVTGTSNHNVFTTNQNLFGSDRIHQMNFGPMGKMNGSRPQSPYHTQINAVQLDQPLFDLNKGKQLK